ncbi:hypothetical protein NUW58_g9680 [Xylaria curta]|uniref:Uncharacterized protein n=1 Tax=Xylaria curta TaxID=42375 RepID=A0ACC1MWB7_9PEZI|nr:hypothetical protein NUW58_g9680 [Xylaria curta]
MFVWSWGGASHEQTETTDHDTPHFGLRKAIYFKAKNRSRATGVAGVGEANRTVAKRNLDYLGTYYTLGKQCTTTSSEPGETAHFGPCATLDTIVRVFAAENLLEMNSAVPTDTIRINNYAMIPRGAYRPMSNRACLW